MTQHRTPSAVQFGWDLRMTTGRKRLVKPVKNCRLSRGSFPVRDFLCPALVSDVKRDRYIHDGSAARCLPTNHQARGYRELAARRLPAERPISPRGPLREDVELGRRQPLCRDGSGQTPCDLQRWYGEVIGSVRSPGQRLPKLGH